MLRTITSDSTLKTIPVVMLTSSRAESDLVESYRLGVNGYGVKPVDVHHFMSAVKHLGIYWAIVNESPCDRPADYERLQS